MILCFPDLNTVRIVQFVLDLVAAASAMTVPHVLILPAENKRKLHK